MVHFPIALLGGWTLQLEARALGSFFCLWTVRDMWWFIANPAMGWSSISPERAPWIKQWLLGFPSDWWLLSILGLGLIGWSYFLHVRAGTTPVEFEEPMK
jgi:hypothetical protein